MLFIAHPIIEGTFRSQSFMVVRKGRVIVTSATPICLQSLFNGLVAHESDIEPPFRLKQSFSSINVVVSNIKPICYLISYHEKWQKRNPLYIPHQNRKNLINVIPFQENSVSLKRFLETPEDTLLIKVDEQI